MITKLKAWLFGAAAVIVGALAFWGKVMQRKADKYEQKASQARKEADDAIELSRTHSDLSEAQHQAEVLKNESLKNRTKEQPPAGLDFNRNRMRTSGKD